jgi:quercetin dioxygenase-like cupin family protein
MTKATTKLIPICALAVLTVGASSYLAHAQVTATAQKEVLLQADHSWNGVAYTRYPKGRPELTMLKLTIPPHTALPWHRHPVPNAGYVLSGQLTLQDRQSGKSRTFHEGQAFAETVDDVHRGVSGDAPLVLLITYAGTPGTPTSIPVKGEKAEY